MSKINVNDRVCDEKRKCMNCKVAHNDCYLGNHVHDSCFLPQFNFASFSSFSYEMTIETLILDFHFVLSLLGRMPPAFNILEIKLYLFLWQAGKSKRMVNSGCV